ncbi:hypothetical protein [Bifidobacterium platyrrhinorum]|uniref:Uncharacterized protein n=1 Tax=Bifidobacterium platyrrhinorum TaxID=2661628 RepID=A0A6L9SS62_9BIFI|nr:hypothetical protein [Bifidobacterium platyrrhinorum]NEG55427.1 hypothetical protein [Bifidobacterium platyrrhinorum]
MSFTGLICFILLVLAYVSSCRLAYWLTVIAWGEPDDSEDRMLRYFLAAAGGIIVLFVGFCIIWLFLALVFPNSLK